MLGLASSNPVTRSTCGKPTLDGTPCLHPAGCTLDHNTIGAVPAGPPGMAAASIPPADPFAATTNPVDAALAAAAADQTPPASRHTSTSTPWGKADTSYSYGRGTVMYSTPGHGGFLVSPGAAAQMPEPLRRIGEPYAGKLAFEEDCAANAVVVAFPARFSRDQVESALGSLQCWYPDQYEEWSGEPVPVEDSTVLQERQEAAWSDGQLVCVAVTGGGEDPAGQRLSVAHFRVDDTELTVTMPTAEYQARQKAGRGPRTIVFQPALDAHRANTPTIHTDPADITTPEEWNAWRHANPETLTLAGSYYPVGRRYVDAVVTDTQGGRARIRMPKAEFNDRCRHSSWAPKIITPAETETADWETRPTAAGTPPPPPPEAARRDTAANTNTPPGTLAALTADPNEGVQWAAATNTATPPGALAALATHPDLPPSVHHAALTNPNCPAYAQAHAGLLNG